MKLLFVDGTEGFNPKRLKEKATGGILSSLTILPALLAKKGHEVYIKSVHNVTETIDGVHYLSQSEPLQKADVVIFNRNVVNRPLVEQAKATGAKIVWWLHDVVDPRYLQDDGALHIPNILALSDYCKETYKSFYSLPEYKFTVIPNGVNKELFNPGNYSKRNPNLFIFASAPIKGMKPLGFTINNLKRIDPKNELRMYTSQKLHDLQDDAIVNYILKLAKEQGATVLEPISQDELAKVMKEAWILLMPNSYPEICSNLLLQAKASGLPVVASPTGSIPEFLKTGGVITKTSPLDLYLWWKDFAEETIKLAMDKERHERLSKEAPEDVLSWPEVADKWDKFLGELK